MVSLGPCYEHSCAIVGEGDRDGHRGVRARHRDDHQAGVRVIERRDFGYYRRHDRSGWAAIQSE
ncbi:hypothetical protein [Methylobacterium sp. CM6257]